MKKSSRKFCDKIRKLKILVVKSLCCIVLSAVISKTKYEPAILVCKEAVENGERNAVVHETSELNYATITLSSD